MTVAGLREAWRILNQPCREHTLLYSRALDGEVSGEARAALRVHTLMCRGCRRFSRQLAFLSDAARLLADGDEGLASGMPVEVRRRLERRLGDR